MAVTEVQAERAKLAALRALRAEWWSWKRATITDPGFIELCLAPCNIQCGQCEGCLSEYYRKGRREELDTEAAFIKHCRPVMKG